MAHGDEMDRGRSPGPGHYFTYLLLDQAISAGDGPWVDVRGYGHLSIEVEGLGVNLQGAIEIRGTNHPTPSPTLPGHQLGGAILDDGIVLLPTPICWIRASLPDHAPSPTSPVTVLVHASV